MKATVKEITFSKRVNLGNYEHQDTSVVVVPAEGQDPFECLNEAKLLVGGTKPETVPTEPTEKVEPVKKSKKTKTVEEKVVTEEEVVEEKEEEVVKESKPKLKPKVKLTPYDRSNQLHKTFFGEILDSKFPTWKTDKDLKAKAVKASTDLNGQDMLDTEGIVVEEFKEKVHKAMQ